MARDTLQGDGDGHRGLAADHRLLVAELERLRLAGAHPAHHACAYGAAGGW